MKNFCLFFFFATTCSFGQFSIKGTLTKPLKNDWALLYKIESNREIFITNTSIKSDSLDINGTKIATGTFEFELPKNSKPGTYRVTYRQKGARFIDFIFNHENVRFQLHPDAPEASIFFLESAENQLYRAYQDEIFLKQQKLDSIQVAVLRDNTLDLTTEYKKALESVHAVQNQFLARSQGMYVQPFIKASLRKNALEILKTPQAYMANVKGTFFDHFNFSDPILINSSFLNNRVLEYVFYLNYSDDEEKQIELYRASIKTVLSKIEDTRYKKEMIAFLIEQFEPTNNLKIIDELFTSYYNKLPLNLQDPQFIEEKMKLFNTAIGRIAPDFSWTENGVTQQLSSLQGAENYLLVFWSTGCSHCLREIPELYKFLKDTQKIKVIAFSMEENAVRWEQMKKDFPHWHHALGLGKWENKTAKTYSIYSTPSYFVLDKNKKIIEKPALFEDLKIILEQL